MTDEDFARIIADPEAEAAKLRRQLERAHSFSLLFAVCNRADVRDQAIASLQASLGSRRVQVVPIPARTGSLLEYLRATLPESRPDALCIVGLENWISANIPADTLPFYATLNATRNSLAAEVDCPLIFWVPQYLLVAIAHAAPDLFSIRSGIFFFVKEESQRREMMETLSSSGLTHLLGMKKEERETRREELTKLLLEYQNLPEEHRDLSAESRLSDQLAENYYAAGAYGEAEPLFFRALEIREQVLGAEHPQTADSLNNLAVLYRVQGRYAEAEPLYARALAICEKQLGDEHPDTATSLNNLALLYYAQSRYAEAEPLYVRALAIREKQLGAEHPQTADSLNNLAGLYESQGRYAEAEPLYVRALAIREKQLGAEHPDTATSLNNLAGLYYAQSRYAEAEPLLVRAVTVLERALGASHPSTVTVRNNLEAVRV